MNYIVTLFLYWPNIYNKGLYNTDTLECSLKVWSSIPTMIWVLFVTQMNAVIQKHNNNQITYNNNWSTCYNTRIKLEIELKQI